VAGIDQSTNTWWRNRADVAINAGTASNQNLIKKLEDEFPQLRRYGGKPDRALMGSDFMEAFKNELREKGYYTQTGFTRTQDPSMGNLTFDGVPFEYDPTLDDMGLAKYCYILDTKTIHPLVMSGEDMKIHNPARPEDKYVLYRAMTWTGGLVCKKRNANGVYAIL
jgi:rRNA maturation protein Nop10